MRALEDGQKFERYRVIHQLGSGVSGVSYKAEDLLLQRPITLKLIHPWATLPDSARRQFFRDMQSLSLLTQPHQATLLDYGEVNGQLYIVRQFIPAGSLLNPNGRQWFAPPLSIRAATAYAHQIAQALHAIHRHGYIHGSLTFSNVLIALNEPAQHHPVASAFYLSDTSLAQFVRRFGQPRINRYPITAAPEQWQGRTTTASDQYALAVIFYFWLCGQPPFVGSPEQIEQAKRTGSFPTLTLQNDQVTLEQEGIIRRALHPTPEARYPNILAFTEALRSSLINAARTSIVKPVSINIPEPVIPSHQEENTVAESDQEHMSGTFILDQSLLQRLTNHAQHITTPEKPEAETPLTETIVPEESTVITSQDEADDEPVSTTFLLDQALLQQLTTATREEEEDDDLDQHVSLETDIVFVKPDENLGTQSLATTDKPAPKEMDVEVSSPSVLLDRALFQQLSSFSHKNTQQEISQQKEQTAEPVPPTILLDHALFQQLNALSQQIATTREHAEQEPAPQIEPDGPQPHPGETPIPQPEPQPVSPPPAKPEPETPPAPAIPPAPEPDIATPLPLPEQTPIQPEGPDTTPVKDKPVDQPSSNNIQIAGDQQLQIIIYPPDSSNEVKTYLLEHSETTLGRAGSSTILLDQDNSTSRHHAVITYEGNRYAIYDKRSNTGVIVNGVKIEPETPYTLTKGDRIQIGAYMFTITHASLSIQSVLNVAAE